MKRSAIRKASIVSLIGLSAIAITAVGVFANEDFQSMVLGDEATYQTTRSIEFVASDFSGSPVSITKYGNTFNLTGTFSVADGAVTFSKDASFARSEVPTSSSFFYGIKMTGISATPSQSITFGNKSRTWFSLINDRGTGDLRGTYADAAAALAGGGYANIDHQWMNDRVDDPSSFWYESSEFTLTATEGAFSFKSLTLYYTCQQADVSYSRIFANSAYKSWQVVDPDGNALAPILPIGSTLKFKIVTDASVSDSRTYVVTYGNSRNVTTLSLTPDADGVYSLSVAADYGTGELQTVASTYINVSFYNTLNVISVGYTTNTVIQTTLDTEITTEDVTPATSNLKVTINGAAFTLSNFKYWSSHVLQFETSGLTPSLGDVFKVAAGSTFVINDVTYGFASDFECYFNSADVATGVWKQLTGGAITLSFHYGTSSSLMLKSGTTGTPIAIPASGTSTDYNLTDNCVMSLLKNDAVYTGYRVWYFANSGNGLLSFDNTTYAANDVITIKKGSVIGNGLSKVYVVSADASFKWGGSFWATL